MVVTRDWQFVLYPYVVIQFDRECMCDFILESRSVLIANASAERKVQEQVGNTGRHVTASGSSVVG
jgi:hypothetical protein